jgi:tRNA A37 threonylcarbamoyladenosine synthetase subunit TsaC/SUA5/YrdC
MAQYFEVHPDNPQPRLLKQAARCCKRAASLAVPTDSSYALVCHLDDKDAADRLRRIRQVDDKHHLTLLCRDLSELASYARVDNRQYRLLKLGTPGPYTFILEATKEVPRRVSHPSAQDHRPARARPQGPAGAAGAARRAAAGHHVDPAGRDRAPERPRGDPRALRKVLDAIVDAGACPQEPTTVIDLTPMGTGGDPKWCARGAAACRPWGFEPALTTTGLNRSAPSHAVRPSAAWLQGARRCLRQSPVDTSNSSKPF